MSEHPLDPQELEAIQAAIRQGASATPSVPQHEPQPLPLIAADREAQAARPRLAELAQRWARRLARSLRTFVGDVTVDAMGAEVIDAGSLPDELRPMWVALIAPPGRGMLAVAFGGDLIEAAAAKRCGAPAIKAAGRDPSPLALRLFAPAGEAATAALEQTWAEIDRIRIERPVASPDAVASAIGGETVIAATLAVSGATTGRVRLLGRPNVIMPPAERHPTVPADAATIAAALGAVPIEVRVELATIAIKMSELGTLGPGSQIALPVFLDDPMPIYCGDVLKAWGRPVVTRGVIAVEIAAVVTPGRDHR